MISELQSLIRTPYFDTYLKLVESSDLRYELRASQTSFLQLIRSLSDDQLNYRYAPEKWTIAQVIYHTIECEIIFNYRALTIAKEAHAELPGFDENEYTAAAHVEDATVEQLAAFFDSTRQSTLGLLSTLDEAQLQKTGLANGNEVQVSALFYITSGHTRHHQNVINERYLNA